MMVNNNSNRWKGELIYVARYSWSGLVNTAIGFLVIVLAMLLGASPVMSNITGYAVGFFFGFILSKRFVFRSEGRFVVESFRYVISFLISFACNLVVLQLMTNQSGFNAIICQLVAAATYTALMFTLMRFFVFRPSKSDVMPVGS
jgi:putative flippase GtrA